MKVGDLDRSCAFYRAAFGLTLQYRDTTTAMLLGPGPADLLTLTLSPGDAGKTGGIEHFGIRITGPEHFEPLLATIISAGGRLRERGDRGDGQPYAFILDPDGYEIELWHMNTPLVAH
jgi:catechol 2,3-dioxygenase-like lactoylglutathione lyase family enzyme